MNFQNLNPYIDFNLFTGPACEQKKSQYIILRLSKNIIKTYKALISFKISFVTRTAAALFSNNAFSSAFNL